MIFIGLLLAAAATVYAQVTVGVTADMVIVPFQYIQGVDYERSDGTSGRHDGMMGTGIGRIDGQAGPRIRLDARAVNEEHGAGLRLRLQAQANADGAASVGVENFLQAWWAPLDWLRLDAGRFDDDRLRGMIGDDEMHSFSVLMYDEDALFNRIRARSGLMASFTPIEGLLVTALLDNLNPLVRESHNVDAPLGTNPGYRPEHHRPGFPQLTFVPWDSRFGDGRVWRHIHLAAGYNIRDIGMVRVQYIGAIPEAPSLSADATELDINPNAVAAPRIEAAFAFTGVEGLLVDIGGKVPLPINESFPGRSETWQAPFRVSLGARYALGNFEIAGRVDAGFGGEKREDSGTLSFAPKLNAHLWPSYDFGAFRAILNAGFEWVGQTSRTVNSSAVNGGGNAATTIIGDGGKRFGVGLSVQSSIMGRFMVRGGLAYRFPSEVNGIQERGVFSIPLFLEYSF